METEPTKSNKMRKVSKCCLTYTDKLPKIAIPVKNS